MIGILARSIRESRNISQQNAVCEGVSLTTFRKFENDETDISLGLLKDILENLNITIDEFVYLLKMENEDFKDDKAVLLGELPYFQDFNDLCNSLKIQKKNKRIYNTLKCVKCIRENDFDNANRLANMIWDEIKEYEDFYLNDICFLVHIFVAFDEEIHEPLYNSLKKSLVKWRDFRETAKAEILFHINLGRYYEIQEKNNLSISNYKEALNLSLKNNNGLLSGITLYRCGILTNDVELRQKGENVLNLFDINKCYRNTAI